MILEMAKTGRYGEVTLTEADLEQMEKSFGGKVPVTVGHEIAGDMPAAGWVKNIWAESGILMGEAELGDWLKEAYGRGEYRNWSIGAKRDADGRLYLHHLAFLGALPPKIRGLEVVEMGDCDGVITFSGEIPAYFSELEALRREKREKRLTELRTACEGRIPAAKLELVMEFAENLEGTVNFSDGHGADAVSVLKDVFSSLPEPVRAGKMNLPEARAAADTKGIFGKI
ncbi:hypothetical protein EP073_12050 [Geovibrio thiophilus]|uniref:Uncharacterized protein n=1 Tax=Geovibrio thiophilus TaxID=139438 RepID=A0A3R5UZA2_9BACT|nr:hypothetical protein [Geovibrio thiophilus]QAR34109.1 hypothetical protein EP073_12050 [Geovibrio thiophilus]